MLPTLSSRIRRGKLADATFPVFTISHLSVRLRGSDLSLSVQWHLVAESDAEVDPNSCFRLSDPAKFSHNGQGPLVGVRDSVGLVNSTGLTIPLNVCSGGPHTEY